MINQRFNLIYQQHPHILLHTLFVLLLLFLLLACSKTTDTQYGKLSGHVILNNDTSDTALDPLNDAGVKVALYHAETLDPDLLDVNDTYPGIGVQISQQTEFDHRLQNPAYLVTTNAEGSFSFSKISPGMYNLVLLKEGWGVRYLYDINITEGTNSISSVVTDNTIDLYPARILSGFYNEGYVFASEHTYIVDDNVTFSSATLESSASIWINPNKKITFVSSLSTASILNGFCHVTSADSMYNVTKLQSADIDRFDGIYCFSDIPIVNGEINSIITTFSANGWIVQTSNINIRDMVFRFCGIGLQVNNNNTITVSNCNVNNCNNIENGGITLTNANATLISGCVFDSNIVGLRQHTSTSANVSNCYFKDNSNIGIYNLYQTTGLIDHCEFVDSNIAIETSGQSDTNIQYCNIQGDIGILNIMQLNWFYSNVQANYNNFDCTVYSVKSHTLYYSTELIYYNCQYNYWNTSTVSEIESKIWDRNDEDINDPLYFRYMGVVDYSHYRTYRVQNTGITNIAHNAIGFIKVDKH